MISRREALRMGGVALFGAGVLPRGIGMSLPSSSVFPSERLFFDRREIPRIRANARTVLLGPKYLEWAAESPQSILPAWTKFEKSGDIVRDLRDFWFVFTRTALVHVVEPTAERRRVLLEAFENVIRLPKWDYLMDGDDDIGLMRASMAISRLLFAREALGDDFDSQLNDRFLTALVSKGAIPCLRTIKGMDHPDRVVGWRFDPEHPHVGDYSLARWPDILGRNNLRGTATMGLGLAALALEGRDERADEWLKVAVASTYSTFGQFTSGGSYSEGLSYAAYTLRLLLPFCEAHFRLKGTVDWTEAMNWSGLADNIAAMQAGRKSDGTPDVVNFSDASASIYPCVGSWIRNRTGNPVGQFAANYLSVAGFFLDFLWYQPSQRSELPASRLKNYRDDLDWIVCRTGWRPSDAVLAFRSGKPSNHEHADRNSFLYKIYGERLLNDHFGAAYDRKDPRWTLRLTKAHNAVLIGGRGHQYHEGEEGVNEGKAEAKVVSFVDEDRLVYWTSDATHGYRLVNKNVSRVLRTVVFAKPNVIILLDQVDLEQVAEEVEARFFPDNRDDLAEITVDENRFMIKRPNAILQGIAECKATHRLDTMSLDFKDDLLPGVEIDENARYETFPFVRSHSSPSLHQELITVMVASPDEPMKPASLKVRKTKSGWYFEALEIRGFLDTSDKLPKLELSDEI